jgi:hypothetical protein
MYWTVIKNNDMGTMIAIYMSRWNAGGIIVDLTLKDLEERGSIGWFSNDLH